MPCYAQFVFKMQLDGTTRKFPFIPEIERSKKDLGAQQAPDSICAASSCLV